MAFERIELNLIPDGEMPVFHCSQFDAGRPIIIDIMVGDDAYTPSAGVTFELHCRKVDDNIVTLDTYEVDENTVTFASTEQLCACVGDNLCEVSILLDNLVLGTLNFILHVEPDPLAGGLTSETSIYNLTEQVRDITEEVIGDDYYNKTQVDNLLDDKADKSTTYTKTEVDTALNLKADKSNTYTKTEVNSALALKANASDVYTKSQTDTLLNAKANTSDLATVATTGNYNDLTNKPTIPAAQVQSNWTQSDNSKVDYIKNKPTLATVATSGSYDDLTDKPTIPAAQVQSDYAQTDNTKVDFIKNKPDLSIYATQEDFILATGTEDETPYLFRAKPNSAGNRCLDKLVGGTVAFNQYAQKLDAYSNYSMNGIDITANSDNMLTIDGTATGALQYSITKSTITLIKDHKYFVPVPTGLTNLQYYINGVNNNYAGIFNCNYTNEINRYICIKFVGGDSFNNYKMPITPQVIDLTQMFGSTIADYIYSLEQSQAGAGVAWFRNLFPKSYYAYNAGVLKSVQTSKHITTGFNAYDNSTGKAKVVGGNQYQITGTYTSLTLDGETITPNASGIFTPDTSGEITVVGGNATNTCIHLVWDGERNGEYEPYVKHEYDLSGSRLVHRKFGIVDLGMLNWSYNSNLAYFYAELSDMKQATTSGELLNWVQKTYTQIGAMINANWASAPDNSIGTRQATPYICVKDTSYTDATAFKTAMSGQYLIYELATPFDETVSNPELRGIPMLDSNNKLYYYGDTCDDFTNPQIVDDFGTEEYVDTREVPIPVGHDTIYSKKTNYRYW